MTGSAPTIAQENGMSLTLTPDPARRGVASVMLLGTDFRARVEASVRPAMPQQGSLAEFLTAAAGTEPGKAREWMDEGEDIAFEVEFYGEGSVRLGIRTGSNTDDLCDWWLTASLVVTPDDLRRFAHEI